MSKSILIPLRVPEDRREAWKLAAEKSNLTLNEWACNALDANLPREVRENLAKRNPVGRRKKEK